MSALQFTQSRSAGSGMFEARCCSLPDCSKAGRWQVAIMGRDCGFLCSSHKSEWTRTWDACAGKEQHVAAAA